MPALRLPYVGCPLCDGKDMTPLGNYDCSRHPSYRAPLPATMSWLRCRACQHVFTDGYWSDEALSLIFSGTHAHQSPGAGDINQGRAVSAPIVAAVNAVRQAPATAPGRWLDVGFGNGALISTAAEYGYDVLGLDLRQRSVSLLEEMGYPARCADLAALSPDEGTFVRRDLDGGRARTHGVPRAWSAHGAQSP